MKTRIFLFAILLTGLSCQKNDEVLTNEPVDLELKVDEDWWCYILDYGASDPDDWCPATSVYCDCGKAATVTPSLQSIANEFNTAVGDKTVLSNFAQSSDWDTLFQSVSSSENDVLVTVHNIVINESYTNIQVDTVGNTVYYIFQDDSGDLGTLRLNI